MKIPEFRINDDEQILFVSRTHPKVLFMRIVMGVLLLTLSIFAFIYMPFDRFHPAFIWSVQGIIFIIGMYYSIWPVLQWYNAKYVVTNKQIIIFAGVLNKQTHSSQMASVSDINVERDILDRIFKCGTIVFMNAASVGQVNDSTHRVTLKDVPHVLDIEDKIKDLIFRQHSQTPASDR